VAPGPADEPVPQLGKLDPYVLANAFLNYRNALPGLTVGAGAYDIFNAKPAIPQAYNGDYAPIPGRSREYVVKLSYQLNFKTK
jgi:outer membrane receptor protein involved in Fe transport